MIHGGVPAIFSVLESSEVKFPALEGFVLPTDIHVSRGTRLGVARGSVGFKQVEGGREGGAGGEGGDGSCHIDAARSSGCQ